MRDTEVLSSFFHREGAYELCTALLDGDRTRQELITLTDTAERTLARRITEGRELSLITFVPTTGTERTIALNHDDLPQPIHERCRLIRDYHRSTTTDENAPETAVRPFHRDHLGEPEYHDAPVEHSDISGGTSTFIS